MSPTSRNRIEDLLADEALQGLAPEERLEINTLIAATGTQPDESFVMTAAVLELSMLTASDMHAMPVGVRRRLEKAGARWAAGSGEPLSFPEAADPAAKASQQWLRLTRFGLPWAAVAACVVLTAIAWWPASKMDIVSELDATPDKAQFAWAPWENPKMQQVKGEVVWCEKSQKGYMHFVGLPPNDPSAHQYQLWIVDERGMGQRISGGIFNVSGDGEAIVPIQPAIRVRNAAAFAVTMEAPGGTWVSDMSNKVVIASKQ